MTETPFPVGFEDTPDSLRPTVERTYQATLALNQLIASMKNPVGHGTASEFLESILQHGLGAVTPDKAYRNTKSLTDLRFSDGLVGAYLFGKTGLEYTLTFERQQITGMDMFDKYEQLNPKYKAETFRKQLTDHMKNKQPQGYPVLFIYDGSSIKKSQINKAVPSELLFEGTVPRTTLVTLLAPENNIEEASTTLKKYNLHAPILPIEACELL